MVALCECCLWKVHMQQGIKANSTHDSFHQTLPTNKPTAQTTFDWNATKTKGAPASIFAYIPCSEAPSVSPKHACNTPDPVHAITSQVMMRLARCHKIAVTDSLTPSLRCSACIGCSSTLGGSLSGGVTAAWPCTGLSRR
jgi:hypothetical protein